jgi:DJ-1/PfpI family
VTALDAIGPWEVLSRVPGAEVRFVGKEVGPITTEAGTLLLGVTHEIAETLAPDVVVVPGGATTPGQMVDDDILDWLRRVHRTPSWTVSVCTGALGSGGYLERSTRDDALVQDGRAAVRNPGRTNAWCAREDRHRSGGLCRNSIWRFGRPAKSPVVSGPRRSNSSSSTTRTPPFEASHMSKASPEVWRLANKMMDEVVPSDQSRLVPKIAWRRFVDLVRTGR